MRDLTKTIIVSGLIGATGVATYYMSDKKTRKKMMNAERKMMNKASDVLHKMDLM